MRVHGSFAGKQVGHMNDIRNIYDVNLDAIGNAGAILLLPIDGNVVFHGIGTMLQFLQIRGFFGGLTHEDPHDYIHNLLDVCSPFSFKNISWESIWL